MRDIEMSSEALTIPRTWAELEARREVKSNLSNTDRMEEHLKNAWDQGDLGPYIVAMEDGETFVEGSPRADDQEMARILREHARAAGDKVVGNWTLDVCRRALGSALRRFSVRRMKNGK